MVISIVQMIWGMVLTFALGWVMGALITKRGYNQGFDDGKNFPKI